MGAAAAATPPPGPRAQAWQHAQYFEAEDKLVISIDIGNAASSVTLAHLTWGSDSLASAPASKPCIRTVLTYPFCSPHLGASTSARVPSLIAFDREDQPCAFGAECLTDEVQGHVRDGTWLLVHGWKEQMRPTAGGDQSPVRSTATSNGLRERGPKRKLLTKLHRAAHRPENDASSKKGQQLHPVSTRLSSRTTGTVSGNSTSSDGLHDVLDAKTGIPAVPSEPTSPRRVGHLDGRTGALGAILAATARKHDRSAPHGSHNEGIRSPPGPRLTTVYSEFLRFLVACARAYYNDSVPGGEATFVRLFPTLVLVIATPPDWTSAETDLLRQAVEEAKLLPADFEVGRLFFIKEPVAVVHFAKRFISDKSWWQEGASFALVDAASAGTTVVGYHVKATVPRLNVKAYDTARLTAGAERVVEAFRGLLDARLARTKLKSSAVMAHLEQEFREKVLSVFSGEGDAEYRLRIHGKSDGTKEWEKLERAIDSGIRVRDGYLTLSADDVEQCFRPVVDKIIVRLSSILSRGKTRQILLVGGFGDSPYLSSRIKCAAQASLLRPEVPSPAAVSEGAMRLYLTETLIPRRARHAIGVETAVDWSTSWRPDMRDREVLQGSGGIRLVRGKFTPIVQEGDELHREQTWSKPFHLRYRLIARKPLFEAVLYFRTADATLPSDGEEDWVRDANNALSPGFCHAGTVTADLTHLVEQLSVLDAEDPQKAYVQLDLQVGEHRGSSVILERGVV
ncbi:hypothetical protein JCM3774_001438 [Rhodotorula dairenensis]